MYQVITLGSSSAGNCHLISSDGNSYLMLDCGLRSSVLDQSLHKLGIRLSQIQGVLITHEHEDHIKGYAHIQNHVRAYATKGTLEKFPSKNTHHIYPRNPFTVGKYKVLPLSVKHDANDPVNFVIRNAQGEYLVYITDTGEINFELDLLPKVIIIEANHDEEVLREKYNLSETTTIESLQAKKAMFNRVLGGGGHLSIQQTVQLLNRWNTSNCELVLLAHISSANTESLQDVENYVRANTRLNFVFALESTGIQTFATKQSIKPF